RTPAARRGALFGLRRLTLDTLAHRLAFPGLVEAGLATHSLLGQQAIAARVVHEARQSHKLGPFDAVARWPGFARALAATLNELRLHDVPAPRLPDIGWTGEELRWLLASYQRTSTSAGVADRAEVYKLASEAAKELHGPPLGLPTMFLDLPILTPMEEALVAAVAGEAPAMLATVPTGDEISQQALQRALGATVETAEAPSEVSRTVSFLQDFLFSEAAPPASEVSAHVREQVVILSAPGEAQEAVEITRAVQAEAEKGLPFDSMAVLLRSPELYAPLLEDALARAGIPAYFASGTLRPDPAGRAFLSLLYCAEEQLSATRFAEYLSLGQLPALHEDGTPAPTGEASPKEKASWVPPRHEMAPTSPVDQGSRQLDLFAEPEKVPEPEKRPSIEGTLRAPWRWEKLLVDAAVIGGRERWRKRLSGLRRELEERLKEVDDPEGAQAYALRRQMEDLEHLRRFALPVIDLLAALPGEACWGEWLDALEGLASRVLAFPDGVLAILKELRPMQTVGPIELFEVREVLSERLTLLSQEPPSYRYGRLWVAPIEAARGMSFEVVLVPGLAERIFPKKIIEDPLLLDAQRQKLGARLPRQDDRIALERLSLRIAAGAARRKIVFSYPSVDLQKGRSKVPSFYLLEVARASRGELPDFETLERQAAASSGARLGWPAPRQVLDAIDETEHDLAFLSDALQQEVRPEEARGTGRYLMNANPALARSLRARYQRGRSRFTTADGLLEPSPEARQVLEAHRLSSRAYSVTALEKYAACPYRFFLHALLNLRPRETVEEVIHLDALTYGRLMHLAQYEISIELEKENLLPVRPDNLTQVLDTSEQVFSRVARELAEELAPAIERIWRDELARIRADLRGWLRVESEAEGDWVPHRREYTFGMRPRGPADPASLTETAVLANGLRLRGAIDLVEKRRDGKVRITDHKSGKPWVPEGAVVNGGEMLQPLLYGLAYQALSGEEVVGARLYYCTERGGYAERPVAPDEHALQVVSDFQRRLDEIIAQGFFPASPNPPLGCSFCDYLSVCGPRAEIVAQRKQGDSRLSPLNWLRSLE
ncbi:MAG: PD-(D/E)XK nuclease family protein, partial [Acidobacteriota bacterium]